MQKSPAFLDRLSLPSAELFALTGNRISTEIATPATYYGAFRRMLTHADRTQYRTFLLDPAVAEATLFRGRAIHLANRFGISFDEARHIQEIAATNLTAEEASDLVIDNYVKMLEAPGSAYHVFGRFNEFGHPVVVEGTHRCIINELRGLDTPFFVLERHQDWLAFVEFFRREGELLYKNPYALYHGIGHPDFADFEVIREDRSEPILSFLKSHNVGKCGLDVGSMVGFYSHKLGVAGYQMVALEYEAKYAAAFERLSSMYQSHATVRFGDLYGFEAQRGQFDFAIMLSIVYHLLRNDATKCIDWLDSLKEKISLFFVDTETRTGILDEERLRSLFVGFNFELIFEGEDQRNIFAIYRG